MEFRATSKKQEQCLSYSGHAAGTCFKNEFVGPVEDEEIVSNIVNEGKNMFSVKKQPLY